MKNSLLFAVLLITTITSAQEQKPAISPGFSKAANLALVAVRNSNNRAISPDKTVQAAINDADAAAFSDREIAIVRDIKYLAVLRPLQLDLFMMTSQNAAAFATENPNAEKAENDLKQTDGCITAYRLSIHDGNGDKPKQCT
jgi:hypothetical protein